MRLKQMKMLEEMRRERTALVKKVEKLEEKVMAEPRAVRDWECEKSDEARQWVEESLETTVEVV